LADLGLYALRIALVVAVVGVGAGVFAGLRGHARAARVARRAVIALAGLVSLAMVALLWALVTDDFRLEYVASHSARSMLLRYRMAALWGGQAGSLLLWVWMLTM
jgi:cytochrome c-type biogenesis protein CcmF